MKRKYYTEPEVNYDACTDEVKSILKEAGLSCLISAIVADVKHGDMYICY